MSTATTKEHDAAETDLFAGAAGGAVEGFRRAVKAGEVPGVKPDGSPDTPKRRTPRKPAKSKDAKPKSEAMAPPAKAAAKTVVRIPRATARQKAMHLSTSAGPVRVVDLRGSDFLEDRVALIEFSTRAVKFALIEGGKFIPDAGADALSPAARRKLLGTLPPATDGVWAPYLCPLSDEGLKQVLDYKVKAPILNDLRKREQREGTAAIRAVLAELLEATDDGRTFTEVWKGAHTS